MKKKILLTLALMVAGLFHANASYMDGSMITGMIRSSISNYTGLQYISASSAHTNDFVFLKKSLTGYPAGIYQRTSVGWSLFHEMTSTNWIHTLQNGIFATNSSIRTYINIVSNQSFMSATNWMNNNNNFARKNFVASNYVNILNRWTTSSNARYGYVPGSWNTSSNAKYGYIPGSWNTSSNDNYSFARKLWVGSNYVNIANRWTTASNSRYGYIPGSWNSSSNDNYNFSRKSWVTSNYVKIINRWTATSNDGYNFSRKNFIASNYMTIGLVKTNISTSNTRYQLDRWTATSNDNYNFARKTFISSNYMTIGLVKTNISTSNTRYQLDRWTATSNDNYNFSRKNFVASNYMTTGLVRTNISTSNTRYQLDRWTFGSNDRLNFSRKNFVASNYMTTGLVRTNISTSNTRYQLNRWTATSNDGYNFARKNFISSNYMTTGLVRTNISTSNTRYQLDRWTFGSNDRLNFSRKNFVASNYMTTGLVRTNISTSNTRYQLNRWTSTSNDGYNFSRKNWVASNYMTSGLVKTNISTSNTRYQLNRWTATSNDNYNFSRKGFVASNYMTTGLVKTNISTSNTRYQLNRWTSTSNDGYNFSRKNWVASNYITTGLSRTNLQGNISASNTRYAYTRWTATSNDNNNFARKNFVQSNYITTGLSKTNLQGNISASNTRYAYTKWTATSNDNNNFSRKNFISSNYITTGLSRTNIQGNISASNTRYAYTKWTAASNDNNNFSRKSWVQSNYITPGKDNTNIGTAISTSNQRWGYATTGFVTGQGYITSSALIPYATLTYVNQYGTNSTLLTHINVASNQAFISATNWTANKHYGSSSWNTSSNAKYGYVPGSWNTSSNDNYNFARKNWVESNISSSNANYVKTVNMWTTSSNARYGYVPGSWNSSSNNKYNFITTNATRTIISTSNTALRSFITNTITTNLLGLSWTTSNVISATNNLDAVLSLHINTASNQSFMSATNASKTILKPWITNRSIVFASNVTFSKGISFGNNILTISNTSYTQRSWNYYIRMINTSVSSYTLFMLSVASNNGKQVVLRYKGSSGSWVVQPRAGETTTSVSPLTFRRDGVMNLIAVRTNLNWSAQSYFEPSMLSNASTNYARNLISTSLVPYATNSVTYTHINVASNQAFISATNWTAGKHYGASSWNSSSNDTYNFSRKNWVASNYAQFNYVKSNISSSNANYVKIVNRWTSSSNTRYGYVPGTWTTASNTKYGYIPGTWNTSSNAKYGYIPGSWTATSNDNYNFSRKNWVESNISSSNGNYVKTINRWTSSSNSRYGYVPGTWNTSSNAKYGYIPGSWTASSNDTYKFARKNWVQSNISSSNGNYVKIVNRWTTTSNDNYNFARKNFVSSNYMPLVTVATSTNTLVGKGIDTIGRRIFATTNSVTSNWLHASRGIATTNYVMAQTNFRTINVRQVLSAGDNSGTNFSFGSNVGMIWNDMIQISNTSYTQRPGNLFIRMMCNQPTSYTLFLASTVSNNGKVLWLRYRKPSSTGQWVIKPRAGERFALQSNFIMSQDRSTIICIAQKYNKNWSTGSYFQPSMFSNASTNWMNNKGWVTSTSFYSNTLKFGTNTIILTHINTASNQSVATSTNWVNNNNNFARKNWVSSNYITTGLSRTNLQGNISASNTRYAYTKWTATSNDNNNFARKNFVQSNYSKWSATSNDNYNFSRKGFVASNYITIGKEYTNRISLATNSTIRTVIRSNISVSNARWGYITSSALTPYATLTYVNQYGTNTSIYSHINTSSNQAVKTSTNWVLNKNYTPWSSSSNNKYSFITTNAVKILDSASNNAMKIWVTNRSITFQSNVSLTKGVAFGIVTISNTSYTQKSWNYYIRMINTSVSSYTLFMSSVASNNGKQVILRYKGGGGTGAWVLQPRTGEKATSVSPYSFNQDGTLTLIATKTNSTWSVNSFFVPSMLSNGSTNTMKTIASRFPVDINRNGFLNSGSLDTTTAIGYNPTTCLVTITNKNGSAGWSFYQTGVKYTVTSNQSICLTNANNGKTNGFWFVYIDNSTPTGRLTKSKTAWTLLDSKVPVCTIMVSNRLTPSYLFSEERHSVLWDTREHWYEHFTGGTKLISVGGLSGLTAGSGLSNNKVFSIAQTTIADEDIQEILATTPLPNGITNAYTILYRTSTGAWSWTNMKQPFLYHSGGNIEYDNGGTSTATANNTYVNTYILACNILGSQRFIIMQGRNTYATATEALAESFSSFQFSGIPLVEFVAVYQLTWNCRTAGGGNFNNTPGNCAYVSAQQIFANSFSANASTSIPHNSTTGLQEFNSGTPTDYYHLNLVDASNVHYGILTNSLHNSLSATTNVVNVNLSATNNNLAFVGTNVLHGVLTTNVPSYRISQKVQIGTAYSSTDNYSIGSNLGVRFNQIVNLSNTSYTQKNGDYIIRLINNQPTTYTLFLKSCVTNAGQLLEIRYREANATGNWMIWPRSGETVALQSSFVISGDRSTMRMIGNPHNKNWTTLSWFTPSMFSNASTNWAKTTIPSVIGYQHTNLTNYYTLITNNTASTTGIWNSFSPAGRTGTVFFDGSLSSYAVLVGATATFAYSFTAPQVVNIYQMNLSSSGAPGYTTGVTVTASNANGWSTLYSTSYGNAFSQAWDIDIFTNTTAFYKYKWSVSAGASGTSTIYDMKLGYQITNANFRQYVDWKNRLSATNSVMRSATNTLHSVVTNTMTSNNLVNSKYMVTKGFLTSTTNTLKSIYGYYGEICFTNRSTIASPTIVSNGAWMSITNYPTLRTFPNTNYVCWSNGSAVDRLSTNRCIRIGQYGAGLYFITYSVSFVPSSTSARYVTALISRTSGVDSMIPDSSFDMQSSSASTVWPVSSQAIVFLSAGTTIRFGWKMYSANSGTIQVKRYRLSVMRMQ